MLFEVLVDKLRALVAENTEHLGFVNSLKLLARGNVVKQLKDFL